MKDSRLIPVKVLQDEEFKNSFWSYNPEQVIEQASEVFEKEFGIGGFRIAQRRDWNSCGSEKLVNFPENLIRKIPKCDLREVPQFLVAEFKKEVKVLPNNRLKRLFDVVDSLKGTDDKGYMMGFLASRLEKALVMALLEDLSRSCQNKGSIIVGFTGKIMIADENLRLGASTYPEKNCIVMGISSNPCQVFLHELSHLFGAEHSERKQSIMYPEVVNKEQKFTEEDRKQIIKGMQRKQGGDLNESC